MANGEFKRKAKEYGSKVKSKAKNVANKVKTKSKDYSDKVKIIYNKAYKDGWKSCDKTNYPLGTIAIVSVGYGNGFRSKRNYLKLKRKENSLKK